MARFIQIVEFTTTRIDEVLAIGEKFRAAREGGNDGPVPVLQRLTADRDVPNRYLNVIEFDSVEAATENSERPDTTEFAQQMGEFCDGPPIFHNLDVLVTWDR